jgi:hypothetical protein
MIRISIALLGLGIACLVTRAATADVITDWDEKAVAFVTPRLPPPAT